VVHCVASAKDGGGGVAGLQLDACVGRAGGCSKHRHGRRRRRRRRCCLRRWRDANAVPVVRAAWLSVRGAEVDPDV